jgi:hypothetical protein
MKRGRAVLKFKSLPILAGAVIVAATGLLVGLPARPALALVVDGTDFLVLETGANGGNVSIGGTGTTVFGNVGINTGGSIAGVSGTITGELELGSGVSTPSVSGSVGSIETNVASLSGSNSDAVMAFNAAIAALPPMSGGTSETIMGNTTLGPGTYNLSSTLTLNQDQTLTLNGAGTYTFYLAAGMSVSGGQILTENGASAADVVFDDTGTTGVSINGHPSSNPSGNGLIEGTIFAANAPVSLTPGEVVGEIVSGNNINLSSGAEVVSVPAPLIGHGLLVLLAIGGVLSGSKLLENLKKRHLQAA